MHQFITDITNMYNSVEGNKSYNTHYTDTKEIG